MQKIIDRIRERNNFIVTSHINPDGDNVGSSIAMTRYLRELGKNAIHLLEDEIPENLKFLLNNYSIENNSKLLSEKFLKDGFDLIVIDSGDKNRIALDNELILKADCVINIDHHRSNNNYGDLNYVMSNIGSSCEVVSNILRKINPELINKEIATALYTGISTDTGNFMFPSVTADTFYTAAFLTEKGADRDTVGNEIYRNNTLGYRMLTKMLLENFTLKNKVGIMVMTQTMLDETGVEYKDVDTLANLGVDTQGVEIGILVKEQCKGTYKISFRSKNKVNVCELAEKFGGGGHFNAAGCTIKSDESEIIKMLQSEAEKQIQKDLQND